MGVNLAEDVVKPKHLACCVKRSLTSNRICKNISDMPGTLRRLGKTSLVKRLCILAAFSIKTISVSAQGSCNANERWVNCTQSLCGAKTCDELGYPLNCTIDPTTECVGGCICDEQYLRNGENRCVPVVECPSCAGDFNATTGTGTYCGNLCSNYKQIYVLCKETPIYNRCDCKKGYVFNDIIGKCIRPNDCPKPCNGDHYAEKKACASPIQATCANPFVGKSNKCRPPGSCDCVYPYVLHKPNGKCVRYDTCPGSFSIEDFFPTPSPPSSAAADTLIGSPSKDDTSTTVILFSTPSSPASTADTVSLFGLTGPELASRMKLDTLVVRGRDWKYGDEDGGKGAKGTIVRGLLGGFVRVEWDTGKTNSYRMGSDDKYDLDLAEPLSITTATTEQVKVLSGPELAMRMKVYTQVVRGKDWKYGDQDGGKGSVGTVVTGLLDGWVRVEWDNEKVNSYRMGFQDKFDLDLADPFTIPT